MRNDCRPGMFITGGSRGIGRAIVSAAVGSGWDVAFTYRSGKDAATALIAKCAEEAREATVKAWQLDVRDSAAVQVVSKAVLAEFPTIQAIVANAGLNVNGPAFAVSDTDWSSVLDTNLTGSFYVCRAFLPHFVAQRKGRIVLIGSIASSGARGQAAYAASKAGLIGLAGTLAKEYGSRNITSNVLSPGLFETDMTDSTMAQSSKERAIEAGPMKRIGLVTELAATVMFLLSDGAAYINGQTIKVSGGLDWVP